MVSGGTSHRRIRTKSEVSKPHCLAACQGSQSACASQPRDSVAKWSVGKVEAIKKAFKKAQEVARERPIAELVKNSIKRSTRRVNKMKAKLESETRLLEEGRVRLAKLNAQQATPVAGRPSSTLQQMVNQLQLERDSLSQELRRKGWTQMSVQFVVAQKLQDANALEFGSPDVIAPLLHLFSQGASQLASLRQGIREQDAGAMEVHPATRMSVLIDAAEAKRRCLDGGH